MNRKFVTNTRTGDGRREGACHRGVVLEEARMSQTKRGTVVITDGVATCEDHERCSCVSMLLAELNDMAVRAEAAPAHIREHVRRTLAHAIVGCTVVPDDLSTLEVQS